MSRYAGFTLGINEFEVEGVKVIMKPTMGDVDKALEILAKVKMENHLSISELKKYCINLLWNGMEQSEKEESGAKKELEEFVTLHLMQIWVKIQIAYKFIDEEMIKQQIQEK